jgi:hypothetical protein
MGFKELMADEVRRIEQALPHSDREIKALDDAELAAHVETLKDLYVELHLMSVHFQVCQHLEMEVERRKERKVDMRLADAMEEFLGAPRFKRRF